jgi:hypothetical protein
MGIPIVRLSGTPAVVEPIVEISKKKIPGGFRGVNLPGMIERGVEAGPGLEGE